MALKRAVITEELVDLTQDTLTALILRQCIYWSTRVKDLEAYIDEIRQHRPDSSPEQQGCEDEVFDSLYQNGWFYKKAKELKQELMVRDSINTIRRRMKNLIEKGYLWERNNPYNPWDKILQYRVNLAQIEWDLQEMGHTLATVMGEDYPIVKDAINEALGTQAETQQRETSHSQTEQNQETVANYSHTQHSADSSPEGKESISRYQPPGKARQEEVKQKKQQAEQRKFDAIPDGSSTQQQETVETKPVEVVDDSNQPNNQMPTTKKIPTKASEAYLEQHEETLFFQLARAWKVEKDKHMDESRAGVIVQAMIDRIQKGKSKAQDRMLLMMFRQGQLDQYGDSENMREHQEWEKFWEKIGE